MGGGGDLFALANYQLSSWLSVKSTAQLDPPSAPEKGMSVEANAVDEDSHTNAKIILNARQVSGSFSYMQSITDRTALGCELSTTFMGGMNNLTFGARHSFS
jgi:hypothetical protein